MSLLYFEEREEGQAPKRVWPDKYELICHNSRADEITRLMYYIIIPDLDYSLLKKGEGSVMEIYRPKYIVME
ncbi:g12934 [Coccomyxa viridis]|uniref:G12934 protein n=1 Tax=Coccomyxa viridis TaxID=1274662 RepID=A0ABP1GFW6_9CHLO